MRDKMFRHSERTIEEEFKSVVFDGEIEVVGICLVYSAALLTKCTLPLQNGPSGSISCTNG